MKRAAILIGVDKTGDLPKLRDAARGAQLMEAWARAQGMDSIHVFTDDKLPVKIQQIKDAIFKLVDAGNISQLLVYFAGHGVNLQRQEYWLLSDAPNDSQAAVNVATSAALAATCGIPHVLFVSDACRTAPEGIRAQSLRGSEIFPNLEGNTASVDQFFACQLGKPSHELKDPTITSAEFKALYTQELVPALMGTQQQIVEWSGDGANEIGHIHLRPLRDYLAQAVATRLQDLNLQTKVIQVPVAQISSDPPAWISQINRGSSGSLLSLRVNAKPLAPVTTPESATAELLRETLSGSTAEVDASPAADSFAKDVRRLAQPFGSTHHETGCGFKLQGARVVDIVARELRIEFATEQAPHGYDLRVFNPSYPGSNVLLVFDNGTGVLLPAIPEFLCALRFEEGELIDVAYEPSEGTWRWSEYSNRANEIRSLRAIASLATGRGSFKLESEDALAIARQMQFAKGVDPTLGLYAAYAYHDLQRPDLIQQMTYYMESDLGAPLFDIALLARKLNRRKLVPADRLLAPTPLLAQGWTLLRAWDITLPSSLQPLLDHRVPSLWTLFDAKGVNYIRKAFKKGDIL